MWIGETSFRELMSFAFAPDGVTTFTGDDSGRVLAWNRQTGACDELVESQPRETRQAVWALAPAAGGTRLFVPSSRQIRVLELPGGKTVGRVRDTAHLFPRVRNSTDGRFVVATSSGGSVAIWDAATLERHPLPGPLGRLTRVAHAAVVGDDSRVLVIGRGQPEAAVWDLRTGELIHELPVCDIRYPERPIAITGRAFAVVDPMWPNCDVQVYDLATGDPRPPIRHDRPVKGLAVHPSGEFLAVTDGTRDVSLWSVTSGTKVTAWNWRIGRVTAVAFAPDGLTCAVGGAGKFAVFDVDI